MTDTRFKWLVSAVTVCVVAVAAMYFFAPRNASKGEHANNGVGEYVYVDRTNTLHTDRKCSRLNYERMKSSRVGFENLSGAYHFCPKCVSDYQYEILTERVEELKVK